MSDIVNDDDDLSALAAEYVIGTLDPDERTRANVLLDVNEGFRELVRVWERRLGELHLMVEPVEPDPRILERIKSRLGVHLPQAPTLPLMAEKPEPTFEPQPLPLPELRPDVVRPTVEAPTPEQQLAGLIAEADKFSVPREATAVAAEAGETAAEPRAETVAEPHAEALPEARADPLAEAAEAIVAPPTVAPEPSKSEALTSEPVAPSPDSERAEPDQPREHLSRGAPMFLPSVEVRFDRPPQRGATGWRVAALLMTFVAFGLGSLIAAWRFVPERLPPQLQPSAVLGWTDTDQNERAPVQHGTQFEE